MSIIKIEDVAFVRFQAPDLDRMRDFLQDFGLEVIDRDAQRLFACGGGPSPFLHMTELGEPGFAGLGLRAASLDDLETLATAEGAAVAPLDAPGGGKVVTLHDPDGHRVEVIAGQRTTDAEPFPAAASWNSASDRRRLHQLKRTAIGPSHVIRLGHVVLNVSDFRASERWYKDRFGFITSDEIALSPTLSVGAFLRCDLGETPTDHHTLFIVQSPKGPGFNHAAFEVADLDDLMAGHDRLKSAGAVPEWGVGRHILGSQVFDYWRDPWGHTVEHWTDGDLLTVADGSNTASLQDLVGVQWGPPAPPTMG
ncbi:VOC family protein [Phenylobacterium sp.]|jgi:catechol 2,3-dioxygenase-like lactoylglutathione lyase family enzyme|uniref:VOC family protein n=1 Tax=Phenylobacterium sp. TaxID=1871053 RepID=UPI002E3531CB|nr:VOC family protein [Phenylobacterium sp.]HEX4711667.1 VOC family protein [Phenylobacterium sp.]